MPPEIDLEAADRGNDWTPTDDADTEAVAAAAAAAAEASAAKKLEDDLAAEKKVADDAAAAQKLVDDAKTDEEKAADAAKKAEDDAKALEEADKKKDTRIPASRHKQILDAERSKREAVELELSKYKQGGKIADVNAEIGKAEGELLKLEADYAKQLVDGDTAKAAATMTQIRKTERAINDKTSEMRVEAAQARAVETVRYDTTVERLEGEFPALNVDHDDYDKAKTGEVLELKEAYQKIGYTPSQALQKAVKALMPPTTKAQEAALKVEPKVDAAAVEKQRKADAVKKALDASGKQPPLTAKVGVDHDAKGGGAMTAADALKLPYNKFAELNEATLAGMRGDEFIPT